MNDQNDHKDPHEKLTQWIQTQEGSAPISNETVSLSLIVPAYNEYRRLPVTLMEMLDYLDHAVKEKELESYEIIVVDDGSKDETSALVQKFERIRPTVRLIRIPKNYGKGHAVRLGVLNSHGKRVLFADADGATPIKEYERLKSALDEGYDLAIGSRAAHSTITRVKTVWYRKVIGRFYNLLVNLFILPGIADTQCGFKMMQGNVAHYLFQKQQADRFSFDVEILFIARKTALKVKEIPVNWTNVPGSKVNLVWDSLRMFRDIFVFHVRHGKLTEGDFKSFQVKNF